MANPTENPESDAGVHHRGTKRVRNALSLSAWWLNVGSGGKAAEAWLSAPRPGVQAGCYHRGNRNRNTSAILGPNRVSGVADVPAERGAGLIRGPPAARASFGVRPPAAGRQYVRAHSDEVLRAQRPFRTWPARNSSPSAFCRILPEPSQPAILWLHHGAEARAPSADAAGTSLPTCRPGDAPAESTTDVTS